MVLKCKFLINVNLICYYVSQLYKTDGKLGDRLMRLRQNSNGFTLIEMLIGIVVISILLSIASMLMASYNRNDIANRISNYGLSITSAIQKRSAHDGYSFSYWDTNGGRAATNSTISWDENEIQELYFKYLVARKNQKCGSLADGWNPLNDGGDIDTGAETSMENAALVPCEIDSIPNALSIKSQAILVPDTFGSLGEFHLYININDSRIIVGKDDEKLSVFNLVLNKTRENSKSHFDGTYSVRYVKINDLEDQNDDTVLDANQCAIAIENNETCALDLFVNFAGVSNGILKRVDNENFFTDDVTIGKSLATGRQQCAVWQNNSGVWTSTLADCGIKGGKNDDTVSLIVDSISSNNLQITEKDSTGAAVTHLCNQYAAQNSATGNYRLIPHPTTPSVPCGFTKNGSVVQLLSQDAFVDSLYTEKLIGQEIYASMTELFSATDGQVMLKIYNSAHSSINFSIDNRGNIFTAGDLSVGGSITGSKNLNISENGNFLLQNNSSVRFGDGSSVASLNLSRDAAGGFNITSSGNTLNIKNDSDDGLSLTKDASGTKLKIDAPGGVIAENGTDIHSSKSLLTGKFYDNAGISSTESKSLSRVVGADMAQYLMDKNSSISIVGTTKIEGEYTRVRKPNCLSFLDDARYSSPAANPYREFISRTGITAADGKNYARLILIGTYFKTYNSAFGDNQLFSLHAIHSSVDDWDVFMYLSGEGAYSTGAREDGAGGAIGMMLCDLSTLDIAQIQF